MSRTAHVPRLLPKVEASGPIPKGSEGRDSRRNPSILVPSQRKIKATKIHKTCRILPISSMNSRGGVTEYERISLFCPIIMYAEIKKNSGASFSSFTRIGLEKNRLTGSFA